MTTKTDQAFEAGGTEEEAGPLWKRPVVGQRLDAGSKGKEERRQGARTSSRASGVQWTR